MKKVKYSSLVGISAFMVLSQFSCSDKDKSEPDNNPPKDLTEEVVIDFKDVPANLIGGPTMYGANLYPGYDNQITTGYLAPVSEDIYLQFSINYGETFVAEEPYGYSFFAGGVAVSNWYDMTEASYINQLSAYLPDNSSQDNFLVSFGNAVNNEGVTITDIKNSTYSDFTKCGKIYVTDSNGYIVNDPGNSDAYVVGKKKEVEFKSIMVGNTTYVYKIIENGNVFTDSESLEKQEGWFKVQFLSFDDTNPDSKPTGCVESYLANFDKDLESESGYYGKALDTWTNVDLSSLPKCAVLVINLVGSDMGDYGLNTPAYCILDQIKVGINK